MIDASTGAFTDKSNGQCGPNARCLGASGVCACEAPADPVKTVDGSATRCDTFPGHFVRAAVFQAIAAVAGRAMRELEVEAATQAGEAGALPPYDDGITLPQNSPGYNISLPNSRLNDGSFCPAGLVSLDGSKCLADFPEEDWETLTDLAQKTGFRLEEVIKQLVGLVFAKLASEGKRAVEPAMYVSFVEIFQKHKEAAAAAANKAAAASKEKPHFHVVQGEGDERRLVLESNRTKPHLLALEDAPSSPAVTTEDVVDASVSSLPEGAKKQELPTPGRDPIVFHPGHSAPLEQTEPASLKNLLTTNRLRRSPLLLIAAKTPSTSFSDLSPKLQSLATALHAAFTQATVVVDSPVLGSSCSVFGCNPVRGATCVSGGSCECVGGSIADSTAAQVGQLGLCVPSGSPSRFVSTGGCVGSSAHPVSGVTSDGLFAPSEYSGACVCPPGTGFDGVATCVMRRPNQGDKYFVDSASLKTETEGQLWATRAVEGIAAVGACAAAALCLGKKTNAREPKVGAEEPFLG